MSKELILNKMFKNKSTNQLFLPIPRKKVIELLKDNEEIKLIKKINKKDLLGGKE